MPTEAAGGAGDSRPRSPRPRRGPARPPQPGRGARAGGPPARPATGPALRPPPPPFPRRSRVADPAAALGPAPERATSGRTPRQRALLSAGVIGSIGVLLTACFVGWGAFKLASIDREDLSLDLPTGGAKNYLIVGSDSRAEGHPKKGVTAPIEDRKPLADTIMILRIDPASPEPLLLSLPRDLWVTRAGDHEKGRVNAAYGEGPQSLVDTLRDELGIPIHHYVEVDFKGFEGIVDAIGGVPMWFDRPMRDWQSDLEIRERGCVVLDGYDALAFARSRHMQVFEDGKFRFDGTGDLGRISRQQFFIRLTIARVIEKAGRNPLAIKGLVESGTDNVTLDDSLALSDLVRIGNKFSALDADDLATYTLPATPRTTTGGADVLEINREKATPILARFRGPDDPEPPSWEPVDRSAVSVTVLNSSGVSGVAESAAEALARAGFVVPRWGNGAETGRPSEARSQVHHRPGQEAAAEEVAASLVAGAELVEDPDLAEGSVVLYLGADYLGVSALPTPGTSSTSVAAATTTPTGDDIPSGSQVLVLNSSGATGAAAAAATDLVSAGFTVPRTGNGAELGHPTETRTLVRYGAGGEDAARRLADRLTGGAEVAEAADLDAGVVVLFLGSDYAGVTAAKATTTTTTAPTTTAPEGTAPTTTATTTPGAGKATAKPGSSEAVGELPVGTPPAGESCG